MKNNRKKKETKKWNEEAMFMKFFKKEPKYVLGKMPLFVNFEYPLFNAMVYLIEDNDLLSAIPTKRKRIGSIDVVWGNQAVLYITEVKYKNPRSQSDFWDALKVLGYTAYWKWINPNSAKKVVPTIFMPIDYIELQDVIIARKLHIALFGIVKGIDGLYKVKDTRKISDSFWVRKRE